MEKTIGHPRVVVGVDRSPAGYAALRVALGIARASGTPLHAVRAEPGIGASTCEYIKAAFYEALGGAPDDVDVHMDVTAGPVCGALTGSATEPLDIIVVGNDGRGAAHAIWSGSVGRSLFKRARCQLLIVPAPEMQKATRRSARKLRASRTDVWDRFETEVPELRGRPYQGA